MSPSSRAISSEEKEQKRNQILDAAETLWLEDSHEIASMNRVATAAGVAKGTLYLCHHDVTPKLLEIARAFQLEPQILSAKATHKQPARNTGRRPAWWDNAKAAILDHFADGQWFTAGQVKAITGILRPSRLLTSMYHKGLLQREGIKKGTRYRVAPQKGENDNG